MAPGLSSSPQDASSDHVTNQGSVGMLTSMTTMNGTQQFDITVDDKDESVRPQGETGNSAIELSIDEAAALAALLGSDELAAAKGSEVLLRRKLLEQLKAKHRKLNELTEEIAAKDRELATLTEEVEAKDRELATLKQATSADANTAFRNGFFASGERKVKVVKVRTKRLIGEGKGVGSEALDIDRNNTKEVADLGLAFDAAASPGRCASPDPFGSPRLCASPEEDSGVQYESGGVVAQNGYMYFAPSKASKVLSIRMEDHKVAFIGPALAGGNRKYRARGVLASNGCIFFAPYQAKKVLCVDPSTQTVRTIGDEMGPDHQFATEGSLMPDGSICFTSNSADAPVLLCINPAERKITLINVNSGAFDNTERVDSSPALASPENASGLT
jgi:hypothetical protein